jgi:hypothetical protein
MVLARVLGEEAFLNRVKIYATDVDEQALDVARHGAYTPRQIEDVPSEALERFFERTDQRYVFRKDLRRNVIFGRNDLVQDAPISRIDLLVCRNTLMYFTAETQSRILGRFHFALDNDGILVLGKSEMLITHSDLFTPVDLKRRIFRKVVKRSARHERARLAPYAHRDGSLEALAGDGQRPGAADVQPERGRLGETDTGSRGLLSPPGAARSFRCGGQGSQRDRGELRQMGTASGTGALPQRPDCAAAARR